MRKALTVDNFMHGLRQRNPHEAEFHQAVHEVVCDLIPYVKSNPAYREAQILERITEPDRIIVFRVCWHDDCGNIRTNRGYRVQFNNAIGPYKGGLRFSRGLNLGILKFLGFEQTFKNSLTALPLGAAKGGANFNPKGKSDGEIMRFCQALMTELHRYIGPELDIPAGDGGVGSREISFLFGQYKRLTHHFNGALTGKALAFGGSQIRSEATGYGCAYFIRSMLSHDGDSLEGKVCALSGAGNVALHCADKLQQLGAKVVSLSDTGGTLHVKQGLDSDTIAALIDTKLYQHGTLKAFAKRHRLRFVADSKPWGLPCDIAVPCATQNELDEDDAKTLIDNHCKLVVEGANMPVTGKARRVLQQAGVGFAPGKAANAGGVAVSGLEMSQNATGIYWSASEVENQLITIMERIHQQCLEHGSGKRRVDYVKGANIAGFIKVAEAMIAYGAI